MAAWLAGSRTELIQLLLRLAISTQARASNVLPKAIRFAGPIVQVIQNLEVLKANLLSLGVRKLLALGVIGAVTTLLVAAVGYYASRSDVEPLYVGLTQTDVSRMGSVLRAAGISFDVSSDGTKVLVRKVEAPRARMLLAEKGLPSGSTAGYELFDKLGPLGLTTFLQEVTRTRALEGELARTIQAVKGVKWARVHIVFPEKSSFRRGQRQASASVIIRFEGLRDASTALVIRHLIASAVPSLDPEHVSVMSTDGAMLVSPGDGSGIGSARHIDAERSISNQLQESIRRTLAPYLGVENFEVTVAATLNFDKRQESEQVFDPEKKIERSTRVVKEQGSSQNNVARQTISVEQNIPGEGDAKGPGEQSRKNNERREELSNFEINSKTVSTTSEGHRIESISVAVVMNKKRLIAALGGAPDAEAIKRQIEEVEAVVSAAAGLKLARGDKVNVAAFDFSETMVGGSASPGAVDILIANLDRIIIAITALAAIAIFAWLGLLPAVRTISGQFAARHQTEAVGGLASIALPTQRDDENLSLSVNDPISLGSPATTAVSVQRQLADLVEADDRQVAAILKQWLAKE
jgi:flagellar M-ring protein FliF